MEPGGSVTQIHFDTLRTHNLFFPNQRWKTWAIISPSAN